MDTKLIAGAALVRAMQEAINNLSDGYDSVASIAKHFKDEDLTALEELGQDEAESAREKVAAHRPPRMRASLGGHARAQEGRQG